MATTVTPVLSSSVGYIDNVTDQVATLLRFMIMNPGWTSSLVEQDLLSFRKVSSAYEGNRGMLADTLQAKFHDRLAYMFPNHEFDLQFTTEDFDTNDPDGRYTIKFSIMIKERTETGTETIVTTTPALISGDVTVDPTTNGINIAYNRNSDAILI